MHWSAFIIFSVSSKNSCPVCVQKQSVNRPLGRIAKPQIIPSNFFPLASPPPELRQIDANRVPALQDSLKYTIFLERFFFFSNPHTCHVLLYNLGRAGANEIHSQANFLCDADGRKERLSSAGRQRTLAESEETLPRQRFKQHTLVIAGTTVRNSLVPVTSLWVKLGRGPTSSTSLGFLSTRIEKENETIHDFCYKICI